MKVKYVTANKQLAFELEGKDNKEIFDQVAHIQEVFEQPECANCKESDFKLSHRVVSKSGKTYHYRELVCNNCYHRLGFGQKQDDQSLFPQRVDKDGNKKGKNGWHKWEPDDTEE